MLNKFSKFIISFLIVNNPKMLILAYAEYKLYFVFYKNFKCKIRDNNFSCNKYFLDSIIKLKDIVRNFYDIILYLNYDS